MKKLIRRLFKITLWSLPFLALTGWFVVENVLPYTPIKPYRTNKERRGWMLPLGSEPSNYGLNARPLNIQTPDSLSLKGLFIPAITALPDHQKPITLILVHGIGGCKEHLLPFAQKLAQRGISNVLLDLRAHGESGGEYCTFGFYEKYDLSALVDTLLALNPEQTIGIFGNSLGGAIALQTLAEDKRLHFGIIESTFHDLEAVTAEYGEDLFGVKSFWLAHHVLEKSAVIAHFDPFSVKPGEAARHITQPVFMAHGDQDDRIPIGFGKINFDHLASSQKTWYTVSGAGHLNIGRKGGEAYFEAMMGFLEGVK